MSVRKRTKSRTDANFPAIRNMNPAGELKFITELGLFEIADSGTLFLDEVMEMPAQLQSKLLRALETRTFFRVGGVKKVEVDVRLVAATNRNIQQSVSEGVFRADHK